MPKEFISQHAVEFHETDAAGIVHFSKFPTWIENAERQWIESLGFDYFSDTGIQLSGFPKVSFNCNYHHPVQFHDKLEILLSVEKLGNTSIHYSFIIKNQAAICCANGTLVSIFAIYNREKKEIESCEIPEFLRKQLSIT